MKFSDSGVRRANALSKRILDLAPAAEDADPSPALAEAYAAVNWRLSRFARLRDEFDLLCQCLSLLISLPRPLKCRSALR